MTTGNCRTGPSFGKLLQTNGIEPTPQPKTRPKVIMYREVTLALLVVIRRQRGEERGHSAPDLEVNGGRRCGSGAMGKERPSV
jgi:hypothetical protein